jgi:hypothetical protein
VHFAINAQQTAVGINHRRAVVVKAGAAPLEEGSNDDDLEAAGQLLQDGGAGAGDRLGQFKMRVVLALAEILGAKKFLRANNLSAPPGGGGDTLKGAGEIRGRNGDWISPSVTAGEARSLGFFVFKFPPEEDALARRPYLR